MNPLVETRLVILLLLLGIVNLNSQSLISKSIENRLNEGNTFQKFSLFSLQKDKVETEIESAVEAPTFLKLNASELDRLRALAPENISFRIPLNLTDSITVILIKTSIFSEDFSISYSNGSNLEHDLGVHYWGINPFSPNSLVAISVYENDLMGIIGQESGNWNLGKLENKTDEFILYNDKNIKAQSFDFKCATDDELAIIPPPATNKGGNNNPKCIDIYVEVNYDIYAHRLSGTTAYVSSLFSQSAILFANAGITIRFSSMYIWNVPSPYNGANSSQILNQFQAQTNSWNGDIAHLLTYHNYGGVAATINGLCHNNMNSRMCFSGLFDSFIQSVPIYSWPVYVFSHEVGHLLGSQHTHACAWNGNNTAIDGCSTVEGNCGQPGYPSNGGTVMSYCHLVFGVGVNFYKGFHAQTASRMNTAINNASCIALCSGGCVADLMLTGSESGTANYSAQNTITSTQLLNASSDVDYNAGSRVSMKPGFHAKPGTRFHGFIASCYNVQLNQPDNKQNQQQLPKNQLNLDKGVLTFQNMPETYSSFFFELELYDSSNFSLIVNNKNGQELFNKVEQLNTGTYIFPVQHLAPDIYFATLKIDDKVDVMKILITE